MLHKTVSHLVCPRCTAPLKLSGTAPANPIQREAELEIRSGVLQCTACAHEYPILRGVAVVVDDVEDYLLSHVKGVSRVVPDDEIPAAYRESFLDAKAQIETEHIEEDLEADRVNALYVMSHYLKASNPGSTPWWAPPSGVGSPLIDSLIRSHWDSGPAAELTKWFQGKPTSLVELGCGTGGLYAALRPCLSDYLGVDSSFASIALARHLALGYPYSGTIQIPGDLLFGTTSRAVDLPIPPTPLTSADFIVGNVTAPPLVHGTWQNSASLNMIDMLEFPEQLPELQHELLVKGGRAIQSCPYIWHDTIARALRESLPPATLASHDSARAVEYLYKNTGFKIEQSIDHIPWLFFKHVRQLEIYSVHLFSARKH